MLRQVSAALSGRPIRGFLTDEIREHGVRVGFTIASFDGTAATLAHVRSRSTHRVGRYGVDVAALDDIVGSALARDPAPDVHVVDEIGKMECLSTSFIDAVSVILESSACLVATVALHGGGFIASLKRRPDVEVWELTHANRDAMPGRVVDWIKARLTP
ncbi:MAG: hypothetical protein HY906_16495 [Deltaproteobacteria bacterium]|nr:hypothetical protein [Deltaproteobacteria bacterium]